MKAIILCKRLNVGLKSIIKAANDIGIKIEYNPNFNIAENDAVKIYMTIEDNYWKYCN